MTLRTKYTIDATGHDPTVAHQLKNPGGTHPITGEGFIWADRAGATIPEHTKEAFPGLIVAGMAENAVAG
jgi:ribulose 1,5-bisphosphate synthetase/thiazole synthase